MIRSAGNLRLRLILDVIKHFGPSWVLARVEHLLLLHAGHFRRSCPLGTWNLSNDITFRSDHGATADNYKNFRLTESPQFLFTPSQTNELGNICCAWDKEGTGPIQEVEHLINGHFLLFGNLILDTGFPPIWHRNYLHNLNSPRHTHWSTLSDFAYGDIKLIWELSRFTFTFALVRTYARTGKEKYAEAFWIAVEDWLENNQPQAGVNWKCGQEISLRLMSWCFGLHAFLESPATNGKRVSKLVQALHLFGRRIEANLNYALSQNNNHGVSETAGLWTLGVLFPEFREAERWQKLGASQLERQAVKLIYSDGTFSQQSPNYHRLVLQLYTWVLGLGRLNDQEFSSELHDLLRAALNWSYQLIEFQNGRMPSSGGHDGAHLLPLSNCAYDDHRPTLQALSYILNGELLFPPGPWDEQVLWMFGSAALMAPRRSNTQADFCGREGSFHVLRNSESWAVLHCGPYRHRPAHADLLHLDVWWKGINVALDAGSYSYNPQGPMKKGLAGTEFHNTVGLAGQDQMNRVGPFMWLPWAHSILLGAGRSNGGLLAWMEGGHLGYQRLRGGPIHRRMVISIDGQWWLVLDFLSNDEWPSRLHWLLADAPHKWDPQTGCLVLQYPVGSYQVMVGADGEGNEAEMLRADPISPRGWCSPFYQSREPAISLALHAPSSQIFWTALGPVGFHLQRQANNFILVAEGAQVKVSLQPEDNLVLASSGFVELQGSKQDILILPGNRFSK